MAAKFISLLGPQCTDVDRYNSGYKFTDMNACRNKAAKKPKTQPANQIASESKFVREDQSKLTFANILNGKIKNSC